MAEQQAYPPVSPYLSVDDGKAAIAFYAQAFGAEETEHYDFEGKVGHSTLKIGGGFVMLADDYPALHEIIGVQPPNSLGGTTVTINLTVDDVDTWHNRAIGAGATTLRAPADEFYGRQCKLRDPFGHVWSLIGPTKG